MAKMGAEKLDFHEKSVKFRGFRTFRVRGGFGPRSKGAGSIGG